MAKSYFSCSKCGANVQVNAASRKEADRYAKQLEKKGSTCQDCKREEHDAQNAEAARRNEAEGLPTLTGSPKQVAWAETIRATALSDLALFYSVFEARASGYFFDSPEMEAIVAQARVDATTFRYVAEDMFDKVGTLQRCAAFIRILRAQTSAAWWIDHRYPNYAVTAQIIAQQITDAVLQESAAAPPKLVEAAAREAYVIPTGEAASQCVAEVSLHARCVRVTFPAKNDKFRFAIKALGYRWSSDHWEKPLGLRTGDPVDRAAEVAHRLVAAGFIVTVHNEEARARAIAGQFKPEQLRWIINVADGRYRGWCIIMWPQSDDLYNAARSLPGSRVRRGNAMIPPGSIESTMEFAERYGFSVSDGVHDLLSAHRDALERGAVLTTVMQQPEPVHANWSDVPKKIAVPDTVDVAADLMDEVDHE